MMLWVSIYVVLLGVASICLAAPCPSGYWGPTCGGRCHCAVKSDICRDTDGHCLQAGCSRGYAGAPSCQTKCPAGSFGLECSLHCHCPAGDVCDHVNGQCSSERCAFGYTSTGCQIRLPVFSVAPNVTSITTTQALVSWRPWSSSVDPGEPPVAEYHLQYKGNNFDWTTYDVISVASRPEPTSYSRMVTGLVAMATYEFRLALARSDDGKVGAPFPGPGTSIKACNGPSESVKRLAATQELVGTDQVTISLHWTAPPTGTSGCGSIQSHQVTLQCEGCTTRVAVIPMPQVTYTFTQIRADVAKSIRVAAMNDAGQTGPSETLIAMSLIAPRPTQAPPAVSTTLGYSSSSALTREEGSESNSGGVVSLASTENSLELHWPDLGASRYEIILTINSSYSSPELKGQTQQKITMAGSYLLVHSLHPATRYNITVTPNTAATPVYMLAWTDPLQPPSPPNPSLSKISFFGASIHIKPFKIKTGPLTAYQVIMERLTSPEALGNTLRIKRTVGGGATSMFDNLKDFENSQNDGLNYYITAEITGSTLGAGINFTIGDGEEYNGYYNTQLEESTKYIVWLGLISTLSGVTKRTFVNVQGTPTDGSTFSTLPSNPMPTLEAVDGGASAVALGVGLFFFFLILILVAILIFCMWKRGYEIVCPSYLLECFANNRFRRRRHMTAKRERLFDLISGDHNINPSNKENNTMTKTTSSTLEDFIHDYELSYHNKKNLLSGDFAKLPRGLTSTAYVATSVQNLHLNRSSQIVAYDSNRLCMLAKSKGENDYINATLMRGPHEKSYIVTQSPLPITVNHFWRIIWDFRICHVVMLFDHTHESSETMPQYWPKEGQSHRYGKFEVKLVKEERYAFYNVRSFEVSINSENEIRYVRQFQYTDWQDSSGVPGSVIPFLEFIMRCQKNSESADKCLVHCQTGGGRSGLFIAIELLIEESKVTSSVDIHKCVSMLCLERPGLMKNLSQYHFIYQALYHALSYKNSLVSRRDFTAYIDNLNYVAVGNKTLMQLEFDKMLRLTPRSAILIGERFQSPAKGFSQPSSRLSVKQHTSPPLLLLDSYKEKAHYLLMEHPSETKICLFWKNIHTLCCSCIIRLSDPDDSSYPLLPDAGLEKQYGDLMVKHEFTINHSEILIERQITLKSTSNGSSISIVLFNLYWRDDKPSPHVRTMLDVWRRIKFLTQRKHGKVTVVSEHGSLRSALFCCSSVLLDKMEREGAVDIFQFVKHLRTEVPEAVSTLEQYKFCYRVVREYLRQTEQAHNTSHDLNATIPSHPFQSPLRLCSSTPKLGSPARTLVENRSSPVIIHVENRHSPARKPVLEHQSPSKMAAEFPVLNMRKLLQTGVKVMVDPCDHAVIKSSSETSSASKPISQSTSSKSFRGSGEDGTSTSESIVKHRIGQVPEVEFECTRAFTSADLPCSPKGKESQWKEILRDAARLRRESPVGEIDDPVIERILGQSLLYEKEDNIELMKSRTLPTNTTKTVSPKKPSRSPQKLKRNPKDHSSFGIENQFQGTGIQGSPNLAWSGSQEENKESPSKKRKARLQQIGKALPRIGGI